MWKYIRQLTTESAIYGLSKAIVKMANIFLVPLYTHYFSPHDYGVLSIISNGIFFATIFATLGLETASGIFFWEKNSVDEQKKTFSTWFWAQTVFSIFLFAIIFFSGNFLNEILFPATDAKIYIMLGAGILVCSLPAEICLNWLRLQRKAKSAFIFSLFIFLLTIFLNILFIIWEQLGLTGIFLSQLVTGIAGTIACIIIMNDWIFLKYFNFSHLQKMLKFSYPLIPASLAFWLLNSSAVYFISDFLGTANSGVYQVGSTLAAGLGIIVSAFQMAWGPFALSIQKNHDAKKIYALAFKLYAGISTFLGVFLFLFSKEILQIFTTENYFAADIVAGILGFGIISGGYTYIASIGLNIVKTSVPYSVATISSALVTLVLFCILINPLGIEGAALSTFIGQLFVPICLFLKAQKKFPIPYDFSNALLMFCSGIAVCVIFYFMKPYWGISEKILISIGFFTFIIFANRKILKTMKQEFKNLT